MKLRISLCLAVLAAGAAHAQILRPEAANGAARGRIDGAVGRHGDLGHEGRRGPAGPGFGAPRHVQVGRSGYHGTGSYIHRHAPAAHARYYGPVRGDHGYGGRTHGYVSYSHFPRPYRYGYLDYHGYPDYYGYWPGWSIGYQPGYAYDYGSYYPDYGYRSSAAASGLFWGGLAGAIIGHNSGEFRHNAWRGAAWGAGAGWLLGTIADANRRAAPYPAAVVQPAPAAVPPSPSAQPQPVTIINNYYNTPATPMSAANGVFGR